MAKPWGREGLVWERRAKFTCCSVYLGEEGEERREGGLTPLLLIASP